MGVFPPDHEATFFRLLRQVGDAVSAHCLGGICSAGVPTRDFVFAREWGHPRYMWRRNVATVHSLQFTVGTAG